MTSKVYGDLQMSWKANEELECYTRFDLAHSFSRRCLLIGASSFQLFGVKRSLNILVNTPVNFKL